MVKQLLFIFLLLASVEFFTLSFIGETTAKLIGVATLITGVAAIAWKVIARSRYERRRVGGRTLAFSGGIVMIMLSVGLSMVGAAVLHDQPLEVSVVVQRFMYFYIIYFFLHSSGIEAASVERGALLVAAIYMILYLYVWRNPESQILNSKILEDTTRSTTRVYLPGTLFLVYTYFLLLQKALRLRNVFVLGFLSLTLFTVIATGSRMVIFPLLFLSFVYLWKTARIGRVVQVLLAVAALGSVIVAVWPIIEAIGSITLSAWSVGGVPNLSVRLESAAFYVFQFSPTVLGFLIGNGVASQKVDYGQDVLFYKQSYGYYQSDIGILGDYSRFGLLYLVGVVLILVKVFRLKLSRDYAYLRYFMLFVALTMITLSHFGYPDGIACISCALYLIDRKRLPT